MSIIRNQEALEQPLDFSSLSRFSNGVTDLDACVNLKNGYLIDIEVKKDTFSHTFENIRFSRQWRILETKAGTNPTNILIYAVHDMPIGRNINILPSRCIVKRVQIAGFSRPEFINKSLVEVVEIISKWPSLYKYLIDVRYPNGDIRHCITKNYENIHKWISSNYMPLYMDLNTLEEAETYILERWNGKVKGEYINRNNTYQIYRKLNDSNIAPWELVKSMTWD